MHLEEPATFFKIYPKPALVAEEAPVKDSYFPRETLEEAYDCCDDLLEKAAETKTDTSTKTSEEDEKRKLVTKSS